MTFAFSETLRGVGNPHALHGADMSLAVGQGDVGFGFWPQSGLRVVVVGY